MKLKKKKKPVQHQESSESSSSEADVSLADDDSDLDLPPGNRDLDSADADCLFCGGKYSQDSKGELWIQCLMCRLWAHVDCSGAEKDNYVCDFCS